MQYFCIVERKIADTFSLDKKKKKKISAKSHFSEWKEESFDCNKL